MHPSLRILIVVFVVFARKLIAFANVSVLHYPRRATETSQPNGLNREF